MKIVSWNVNGIRAARRAGFLDWLGTESADLVCLQETKVHDPELLADELAQPAGYHAHWHGAARPGYAGVATLSRRRPRAVQHGLGVGPIDREGRVLTTEHPGFTLVNAYFPHTRHDHSRLSAKLRFCRALARHANGLREAGHKVIVCGDFNIAHREIDLANPVANRRNAGFLPQERRWLERMTRAGWIDGFRALCDEPGHYTWWSYRGDVRERNVGWRIDLFLLSPDLRPRLRHVHHQTDVLGSDHCPIVLELR